VTDNEEASRGCNGHPGGRLGQHAAKSLEESRRSSEVGIEVLKKWKSLNECRGAKKKIGLLVRKLFDLKASRGFTYILYC